MQERWITDWPVSERWPHYTRANASEVLPDPASPLGQQFSWERGMIPGWRDAYVHSGNYSLDEFDLELPQVVGFFGGYVFLNLSNVRMQGVRSPAITLEQLDLAFFGDHPDVPLARAAWGRRTSRSDGEGPAPYRLDVYGPDLSRSRRVYAGHHCVAGWPS